MLSTSLARCAAELCRCLRNLGRTPRPEGLWSLRLLQVSGQAWPALVVLPPVILEGSAAG